jgi:hypothetical protein
MSHAEPIIRTCRGCGCTDLHACLGGCSWTVQDVDSPTGVCSTCAEQLGFHPHLLAGIGIGFTFDDLDAVAS